MGPLLRAAGRAAAWLAAAGLWVAPALATTAPQAPYEFDVPIYIDVNPVPDTSQLAAADVNGDGLLDIVWGSQGKRFTDGAPEPGRGIFVAFQRPGGHYDFARLYECECMPMQIEPIDTDPDAGSELVFSTYPRPNVLGPAGFRILDIKANGSGTFSELFQNSVLNADQFTLVDVDQDGRDDVFLTYYTGTGIPNEYRYQVWYQRGPMSFVPYLSKPFNYSGRMDWGSSTDTYAWAHRLDMNGDGYDDVVEGWCPSWCLYRQEPYRQLVTAPIAGPVPGVGIDTYYATLGDIDGDGLPDRVQSGFDNWVHVDLQTAENTFSSVGGFYYVYNGGYPVIADFDLNGYADIAIADQDGLSYYMQEAPGDFRGVFFQTFRYYDFARMIAGDFNGDGCPDLLLTSPEDAKYTRGQLSLFRGLHCKGHGDLAVHAAATATRITVDVAATGDAYKDREVRVVIAPALRDDAPLGLEVRAPAGCIPTPSERPRRMFDCLVAVAANQTTQLVFPYTYAPGFAQSVELQATAFLLNGNADSRPGNNRARTAVMIGSPAAPTGGMGAGTSASKHTTPTGAPRGTARPRRGAAP